MEQLDSVYRQIVESSSDAIVYADEGGVIQIWNIGAEAVFGYSRDEALGQTLDLIVPERQRERHWEGYDRVLATGETKYDHGELLAVPALRKDGSRISIEFTVVPVREEGKIIGIAAVIRDVTERWQRDRELRERLRTLEAAAGPTA